MDLSKNGFHSPTKGSVTLGKIIDEIAEFIDSDPKSFYSIVIGSDSQIKHNNGIKECDFVTAIIVHRKGFGARYFWNKDKVKKAPVLRDKIYTETLRSLATAEEIVPVLRQYIDESKYDFEIHIDVGPNGKTRDMIKEVVGMVNGNGYIAKTKPESWGASSVADKHT
ncbi:MAG TPA: ribonuclease H-like YkuK family protein [Candidatus Saccharimonadales bacterium]|nr:ribonuclease H-like YkuK family protein [Candidatus Saccharimonadales bacterium]